MSLEELDVPGWDSCPELGWMSQAGMDVFQLGRTSQGAFQRPILMLPLHMWHLHCDLPVVTMVTSMLLGAEPVGTQGWTGGDEPPLPSESVLSVARARGALLDRALRGVTAVGPPVPSETLLPCGASSFLLQPLGFISPCKSCFQASTRQKQSRQEWGHLLFTPELGCSSVAPHAGIHQWVQPLHGRFWQAGSWIHRSSCLEQAQASPPSEVAQGDAWLGGTHCSPHPREEPVGPGAISIRPAAR